MTETMGFDQSGSTKCREAEIMNRSSLSNLRYNWSLVSVLAIWHCGQTQLGFGLPGWHSALGHGDRGSGETIWAREFGIDFFLQNFLTFEATPGTFSHSLSPSLKPQQRETFVVMCCWFGCKCFSQQVMYLSSSHLCLLHQASWHPERVDFSKQTNVCMRLCKDERLWLSLNTEEHWSDMEHRPARVCLNMCLNMCTCVCVHKCVHMGVLMHMSVNVLVCGWVCVCERSEISTVILGGLVSVLST